MKTAVRITLWLLVGYLMLSIESPLLTAFHVRMYAPDPALAIVVFSATAIEFFPGLVLAVLLGVLRDGFSGGVPIGMHVEIYVLLYLACVALTRRLDYRNVVLTTVVVMLASLLSSVLFFVLSAIFDRDFEQFDLIFRLAIPQALLTAPMGPIVSGLLSFSDDKFGLVEREGGFR